MKDSKINELQSKLEQASYQNQDLQEIIKWMRDNQVKHSTQMRTLGLSKCSCMCGGIDGWICVLHL